MNKEKNKKSRLERFQEEATVKFAGYILASFGLVAGLAWNDAIKSYIEIWFPLTGETAAAKLIYAVILSLVIVLVSIFISKLLKKMQEN